MKHIICLLVFTVLASTSLSSSLLAQTSSSEIQGSPSAKQIVSSEDNVADQDFSRFDRAMNYSPADLNCVGHQCETRMNLDGKSGLCFSGTPAQVCETLQKLAQNTHASYLEGAHEDVRLNGCAFNEATQKLEVGYLISEDFEMHVIHVQKSFPACHF
jgi:hypothetical protein